jgi:hypothetical protein
MPTHKKTKIGLIKFDFESKWVEFNINELKQVPTLTL